MRACMYIYVCVNEERKREHERHSCSRNVDVSCTECADFYYGPNCRSCGHCYRNKMCDKRTGNCPTDGVYTCQAGYRGARCHDGECVSVFTMRSVSPWSRCGVCHAGNDVECVTMFTMWSASPW